MTNAIKVLLQMTSVSLQLVPTLHLLIHINYFFNSICYQLASKARNLLFAIQLFT
jgi:hypothetical protein